MKRKDKAERITKQLEALYPETPIPLTHESPFELLIAVLLSAQSTDKKVNEVTPALFRAAPTPERMAALGADGILKYIREVGLAPTKSRHVAKLCQQLLDDHAGEVPASFAALVAPQVSVHQNRCRDESGIWGPAFPVDTHIHRLAERWGLSSGRNVETTERDLKSLSEALWNKLHPDYIFRP